MQKNYWNLLKTAKWNENQQTMPKYSVLEVVLVERPDFDNSDTLPDEIIHSADALASEITQYLKNNH